MVLDSRARLACLVSAINVAAVVMATLLPTDLVPRTGLGWKTEHFLVYFATTTVLCIASARPYVVAFSLIVVSAFLETLQGITPDRIPDFTAALSGAAGVISAAALVQLLRRWWPILKSAVSTAHPPSSSDGEFGQAASVN